MPLWQQRRRKTLSDTTCCFALYEWHYMVYCTIELSMCFPCLCQRFVCWCTSSRALGMILRRLARLIQGSRSLEVSWGITYTGSSYLRIPREWLFALGRLSTWARCGCGSYYRSVPVAPCWRPWLIQSNVYKQTMRDLCYVRLWSVTRQKDDTRVTRLSTQIGRSAVIHQHKDD